MNYLVETRIAYSIVKELCEQRSHQPSVTTCSIPLSGAPPTQHPHGGDERDRTADPLLAKQVLSHLSYIPMRYGCGPTCAVDPR